MYLCDSSFQPEMLYDPLRISARVGAFDVTLPVAAHMPGGGAASINFMLAVRMRLPADAIEALVDVRERLVVGELGLAFAVGESGCGKGTGVGTLLLEGAIATR